MKAKVSINFEIGQKSELSRSPEHGRETVLLITQLCVFGSILSSYFSDCVLHRLTLKSRFLPPNSGTAIVKRADPGETTAKLASL